MLEIQEFGTNRVSTPLSGFATPNDLVRARMVKPNSDTSPLGSRMNNFMSPCTVTARGPAETGICRIAGAALKVGRCGV